MIGGGGIADHEPRTPAKVRWTCESCPLFYEEMFDIINEITHRTAMISAASYASTHYIRSNHRYCKLAIEHPIGILKREQLINLGDIEATRRELENESWR